jgi:coenzyme F420-reducing hydrogenase alpha subunit
LINSTDYDVSVEYELKACEGVSALEAPRGILYHYYQIDKKGKIKRADCVIPTGQNHANIQHDLQALVAQMSAEGSDEDDIRLKAQMLVRAYDPCISCSVH